MSMNRANINIELTPQSISTLQEIKNWNGMTRKGLVTRLVDWFVNQDRVIQAIILGQIPAEIAPDIIDILQLRKMQTSTATQNHPPSSHITETTPTTTHPDPTPTNIPITIPHLSKNGHISDTNTHELNYY